MLTMTILVKNEADIIEKNIRYHVGKGVDSFVVMDNDSTDGTRDILEKLKKEFEITIIDEKGTYNQAKWMTKLTHIARKKYNPTWLIPNDADEFWWSEDTLKNTLKEAKKAILTVDRFNFLLYEGLKNWWESEIRVENPIFYRKDTQLSSENISIILTKISPKVIIKPLGLIWIRGGNHKALHIFNPIDYFKHYDKIKRFKKIRVFHYPIRSFEQFKKNIQNRRILLKKGAKMGPHYRRWVKLLNEGRLEEEFYNNLVFKQNEIEVLKKYGVIVNEKAMNVLQHIN
ncbi:MAG: glycosyltransferase family 2 protein [Epsilonproteobacteria bacterium]|nr:glycosyltransferase family 2 protein [Campylobacterota bacterium]